MDGINEGSEQIVGNMSRYDVLWGITDVSLIFVRRKRANFVFQTNQIVPIV